MTEFNKGLGWKPDLKTFANSVESVSRLLMTSKFGAAPLPPKFDALSSLAHILDQVDTSECTGFSLVGACSARLRHMGFRPEPFTPQFPYSGGRMLAQAGHIRPLVDEGAYPFMVMTFSQRYGLLPDKELPFNPRNPNVEPNIDDFQKASQFRLSHCRRIDLPHLRIEYIQRSLRAGCPVWVGLQVGSEFQRWQHGNKPVGVEFANTGGHMVYLTGYNNETRSFRMPNSWGTNLGDNGFWEVSYDKLESEENASDIYEIAITDTKLTSEEEVAFSARMNAIRTAAQRNGEVMV